MVWEADDEDGLLSTGDGMQSPSQEDQVTFYPYAARMPASYLERPVAIGYDVAL